MLLGSLQRLAFSRLLRRPVLVALAPGGASARGEFEVTLSSGAAEVRFELR
jgi:hypothetical protein